MQAERNPSPLMQSYIQAARKLGLECKVIVQEFNRVLEISDGQKKEYFIGSRTPLNSQSSAMLCDDKYYAGILLRDMGLSTPETIRCVSPRTYLRHPANRKHGMDAALAFAQKMGYPLIVKPNSNSGGRNISLVNSEAELKAAIELVWQIDLLALVQEKITGQEIRLNFLDEEYMIGYTKSPLELIGDGRSTTLELLQKTFPRGAAAAYSSRIEKSSREIDLSQTPPAGAIVNLSTDILNLNHFARVEIVKKPEEKYVSMGREISRRFNLRFMGIDMIRKAGGESVFLEVNAAPTVGSLSELGYTAEVEKHYECLLSAVFKT